LFGRAYCHLCEEMAGALRALGVEFEEIDVDADPRLEELYGENVPVLLQGETEICRHRLTQEAVAKLR
jgi:glutaredoxin